MKKIHDDKIGYAFNIALHAERDMFYRVIAAKCFMSALMHEKFNGMVEYYAGDLGRDTHLVGIGVRDDDGRDEMELFNTLCLKARNAMIGQHAGLRLDLEMSEMTTMLSIRYSFFYEGAARFEDGLPVELRKPEDEEMSFFEALVVRNIEGNQ